MYRSRYSLLTIVRRRLFLERKLQTEVNVLKSPGKQLDLSKNILLHNYVLERMIKWDNKVALECAESNRSYTYLDLRKKSLALANFFKNVLKLREKTTIGVLLPNLLEYPIVILGAMRAGLIVSTLNPAYTKDEIKKQLIHSNSKALIALADRAQEFNSVTEGLGIPLIAVKQRDNATFPSGAINFFDIIDSRVDLSEDIDLHDVNPDDVVFLPYSSGTTGMPKGVELTHKNVVSNLKQTAAKEFINFIEDEDEVVSSFLPYFHIYGLILILLHGLIEGVKLINIPKFNSEIFANSLRRHRPTFIPLVPPVVHLIMNNPQIKPLEDLASVRLVMSGAAPLGASDVERFYEITKGKVDIIQAYGLTETSPLAVKQTKLLKAGFKIGGSGLLIPNTEAKFIPVDGSGSHIGLGPHESGEVLIRGPQVMKGYFNNPTATKETITEDGWLKTGDIGHFDEDGHLYITDRLKELIKVKGFQVAPAELEAIIRDHPSIEDVAVIGVPHSRLGEAPKAFVVTKKGIHVKPEEVKEFVSSKVAKFKNLEGGVVFLDSIPKTPSGKTLRRELKKLN